MSDKIKKSNDKNEDKRIIYLEGERSGHVEKLVNRLGSWKFFQVLYANSFLRIFLCNILMTIIAVPVLYLVFNNTYLMYNGLAAYYPTSTTFLFNSTVWFGFPDYYATVTNEMAVKSAIWGSLLFVWSTIILSGGFAVIRDSFWTGKLKVIKPFFKGIVESAPKMLVFMIVLGGLFTLISLLYNWMLSVMASWIAIILIILVWIAYIQLAVYIMMVYSVVSVHKQSLAHSMSDAFELYRANLIPNNINFVIAFAPVVIFLTQFQSMNMLMQLLMIMMLMIGLFYTVFVWQTFMMKTFRLYHPVELKRVK